MADSSYPRREPMSRLSQSVWPSQRRWQWRPGPSVGWGLDYWQGCLIRLVVIVGLAWGGWFAAASVYRQQHCVELFGHWLAVDRHTDQWGFCQ